MLKNSARNCSFVRSVSTVVLSTEKSTVASPGPISTSRPTLPKVPFGGATNAFGLKYSFAPPRITGPVNAVFHDGRTGLRVSPLFDGLKPSCGVKGKPDCREAMLLSDQPFVSRLCPHGSSHVA